jgi:hypothetical protein
MRASLGQAVVIENVGGAGGSIGVGRVCEMQKLAAEKLPSVRCRAKVRTLLEVRRTRRVHRERVDSALVIRSRHARIMV